MKPLPPDEQSSGGAFSCLKETIMPKPVRIRTDFTQDIATISRISRAVQMDDARDTDFRLAIITRLNEVVRLMQDDSLRLLTPPAKLRKTASR